MLQCAAQCCTVYVAVCCSVLQWVAVCCSVLQWYLAWRDSPCRQRLCVVMCLLQCVALCYSVLQGVTVCCRVLQCARGAWWRDLSCHVTSNT